MSQHTTRRRVIALATACVLSLGLAACGKSSTPDASASSDTSALTGKTVRVWFMEGSISDDAIAYLEKTFAEQNPGNTLKVEIQPWDGIVSKLQTSLASKSESPDLVETGNTQTAVFASVGAFAPVDDLYNKVGGDKLIQSFIDAGRWDNKLYALPLYAGARGIIYRKDLFEKANISVPKTIDELADAAIKLGKANPDNVEGFSGMYLSAVDIHGVESLMFAGGGDYATLSNGKWQEKLTDPATIASLERVQKTFKAYAMDSSASQKSFQKYFNENKVGILVGTGSVAKKIDKELWDAGKVGVMPIPGVKEGSVGQTFAGGSSISLASNAQNPELAKKALEVIFSEKFQTMVAKAGWTPGNTQ